MFFTENAGCRISGNCRKPDIRQLPDAGYPATAGWRIAGFFAGKWKIRPDNPALRDIRPNPIGLGRICFFLPDAGCFSKKMPDIRPNPTYNIYKHVLVVFREGIIHTQKKNWNKKRPKLSKSMLHFFYSISSHYWIITKMIWNI